MSVDPKTGRRPSTAGQPGPFIGGDPPRHRHPARKAGDTTSKQLRGKVTEVTDWRRQVRGAQTAS